MLERWDGLQFLAFCAYVVLSNGLIICVRCTNNDISGSDGPFYIFTYIHERLLRVDIRVPKF